MSGIGSTGQRPGGLTTLAVLNFIFGAVWAIALLGTVALLGLIQQATRELPRKELIYLSLLLGAISVALLIASGVGYLGQKRFLGKILGSVYGLLGLASAGLAIATTKDFGISDIIGLIYPVFTLVLLNTVFKEDFPNP